MDSANDIPADIERRIITAADQLYEDGGKQAFPGVEAVRRKARANMNHTTSVMKAWRRAKFAAMAPVANDVPAEVRNAADQLLHGLWSTACEAANDNLRMAQTGWELERSEAEQTRVELSAAFDQQTAELQTACAAHSALQFAKQESDRQCASQANEIQGLATRLAATDAARLRAEELAAEIRRHAAELKGALEQAQDSGSQFAQRYDRQRDADRAEITRLQAELATVRSDYQETTMQLAHLQGQASAQPMVQTDGHGQPPAERTGAKTAIFYNRQRRHSRLGYVSPTSFADNFKRQVLAA
jgi:DNA repair exonuclease SbcCD ATPase subunit